MTGTGSAGQKGDTMDFKATLMSDIQIDRALTRIAHEIIERNQGIEAVCLLGIKRRGVPLAARIADKIEAIEGSRPPMDTLDITFYRDDLSRLNENPVLNPASFRFDVSGKIIVLVDDVIFTGRTVRAAIDAVFDQGRPAAIQLAELIDRGHRELPLRPDYVGKNVPTSRGELVHVFLTEVDGEDGVALSDLPAAGEPG